MMDCLNFLAPRWGVELDGPFLDAMPWPPAIMKKIFVWWTKTSGADPVLGFNPSWYAVICGYSPFFHSFFYVAAIWALVNGKSKVPLRTPLVNIKLNIPIRDWALFWAGWMISGVIPVFAESLGVSGAVYPSKNKLLFLLGYHSFILFPILTVLRMRGETAENIYHRYSGATAATAPAIKADEPTAVAPASARKRSPSARARSASKASKRQ